jgi:DNA-binding response OmpR family regulator
LLARLRAVTRRGRGAPAEQEKLPDEDLTAGELCLNEGTHVAVLGDEPLDLTPLEFAILASLLRSKGRVKTREQLIDDVSERKFDIFDRSIDVHVSSLRKKLHDDPRRPRFIRTVRAVGYQLIDPTREPRR